MKERAAVSKGQHTVQGSELAAFTAVWISGWGITERQSCLIMAVFHLRLLLCVVMPCSLQRWASGAVPLKHCRQN